MLQVATRYQLAVPDALLVEMMSSTLSPYAVPAKRPSFALRLTYTEK